MEAVITSDIINYSSLTKEKANILLRELYKTFEEVNNNRNNISSDFHIKRGDSIQVEIAKAYEALKVALLLRSKVKMISYWKNQDSKKESIDIRIAIGLGDIQSKRKDINISSGDAYVYSGRTLEAMKKSKITIAFRSGILEMDEELQTELLLLEEIIQGWKRPSAEVSYWILLGYNEKEISEKLKITPSAVYQRKKTAGWKGIEALLNRFEVLTKKYMN